MKFEHFGNVLLLCGKWIIRFIIVNGLWIIYTLFGGVVFGIFPATASLFAIVRKWEKNDCDLNIWKTYHQYYKKDFWEINKLCYIYSAIGCIIGLGLLLTVNHSNLLVNILYVFLLFVFALYLLSALYLLTIYSHFDLKFIDYLIHPFFVMISSLKQNIYIIIGLIIIFYIFLQIPLIIPLFIGIVPAYWIMIILLKRYDKLEQST